MCQYCVEQKNEKHLLLPGELHTNCAKCEALDAYLANTKTDLGYQYIS